MVDFKEEPRGTVVALETGDASGYTFHIWFPYTRGFMGVVREGNLVAVRNFSSNSETKCFSILELSSVIPVHYALGSSPSDTERAFPGFVVEAAKSARVDWEQEKPIEHTTKIRALAIATGVQLSFEGADPPKLERDLSLPMIGEEAYLLTDELTTSVINRGLTGGGIQTIAFCKMVLNPSIDVLISVDEMLRTHFGVFGFTGAGKSNLMSSLVSNLLALKSDIKVLFFDLMSEYTGLLTDMIDQTEKAVILALDENSVPGGDVTLEYLRGDSGKLDAAAASIARTLLLPRELIPHREKFVKSIRKILMANKIRVFDPYSPKIRPSDARAIMEPLVKGNLGVAEGPIRVWLDRRLPEGEDTMDLSELRAMATEATDYISHGIPGLTAPAATATLTGEAPTSSQRVELKATAAGVVGSIRIALQRLTTQSTLPAQARLQFHELQTILNSENSSALVLVQSNSDETLRERSAEFVNRIFDGRRRVGRIGPQILLAFDEADEFIPSQATDSYAASRAAITTVARRGRKFGMGIGIATQRVAYLDTSILAQPHSYFISKLPREYDRETVSNAFGIAKDLLSRTLKFTKGQWLLVSYDATGLENVPIPVQLPNANQRIIGYLNSLA